MVLFHSSFNVILSVICVLGVDARQAVLSSDVRPTEIRPEHRRVKRVFRGSEIADNDFPYIVFLKTFLRSSDKDCVEKLCTGTLIHRRFAITVNSCVNGSIFTLHDNNDIKIFLKTRPYANIENGMSYNVGQQIKTKPSGENVSGKVALILMNDTFAQVTYFPKIHYLQPIAEKTPITCTTVGFSLVGRDLSTPNIGPVRPMSYTFKAQLSVKDCVPDDVTDDEGVYMCHLGPESLPSALCEQGDEGSPLLCKPHANEPAANGTADRPPAANGKADDGLYLYGMASGVANGTKCRSDGSAGDGGGSAAVVFLYVLEHGVWLNEALAEFDELDNQQPNATETDAETDEPTTTTTTSLPDYYDTDDYDVAMKKPIRCKGRYRLAMNGHNAVSISQQLSVVVPSNEHNHRRRRCRRRRRHCPIRLNT